MHWPTTVSCSPVFYIIKMQLHDIKHDMHKYTFQENSIKSFQRYKYNFQRQGSAFPSNVCSFKKHAQKKKEKVSRKYFQKIYDNAS